MKKVVMGLLFASGAVSWLCAEEKIYIYNETNYNLWFDLVSLVGTDCHYRWKQPIPAQTGPEGSGLTYVCNNDVCNYGAPSGGCSGACYNEGYITSPNNPYASNAATLDWYFETPTTARTYAYSGVASYWVCGKSRYIRAYEIAKKVDNADVPFVCVFVTTAIAAMNDHRAGRPTTGDYGSAFNTAYVREFCVKKDTLLNGSK